VAAALSPIRRMVALAGGTLLTAGLLVVAGSASPAAAAPGSGPTAVVALGDSAISGEGAGAYEPDTNGPGGDFCHRSTRALIQQTAIPGIQNKISLACSGAASSDVRINGTTHYTEPSQADRLRTVARDNDVKMIVLQIGAFAGYVSFGWIADRIGRRPAFTLFMVAATGLVPLFAFYARTPALLLSIGILVGFFMHGYFSIFGAMLSELFPTRIRASAQGFCYNSGRLLSAAAPYGIGAFAQRYGFASVIATAALFFAVGGGLIWLLPETKGAEL